jgi:hypothetical protein
MDRISPFVPGDTDRGSARANRFGPRFAAIGGVLGLALVALALVVQQASASVATSEQMERVCRNWLTYIVYQEGTWAGSASPEIIGADDVIQDGVWLARSYSIAPRGHVVVPILLELPPIKAYSEESNLDLSLHAGFPQFLRDDLAPQIRLFVDVYGSLDAVQPDTGRVPFDRSNASRWQRFCADPAVFAAQLQDLARGGRSQVGPLLTTAWHQGNPYNQLCPPGDLTCTVCTPGQPLFPSCVGCVATAVAQVMKFHNWPPYGGESHTYTWLGDRTCGPTTPTTQLSAIFTDPYDWANMPDNTDHGYAPGQAAALSELCYEVGVSIDMDYGVCASRASLPPVQTALPRYFLYDPGIALLYRSSYNDAAWWNLIQAEIDANRPLVYALDPPLQDPHALVVDGYTYNDPGLAPYLYGVHLNFGWGTSYLGWYALDAPAAPGGSWPGSSKNTEEMLTHILPATPQTCLLEANGSGDFPTIQDAIDWMPNGSIIELDDGTYRGTGNWDVHFRGKTLTLRSYWGNPANCAIDCEDQHRRRGVIFDSHEGPGAVLQGISIVNGDGWNSAGDEGAGGAVYCEDACPRIVNCDLSHNVGYAGGAIYCFLHDDLPEGLPGAPVEITGCAFAENSATITSGGAIALGQCPARIRDCVFSGNTAAGGGGAMFVMDRSDSTLIRGCTFIANAAEQQGSAIWRYGLSEDAVLLLANCTLYGSRLSGAICCGTDDGEGPVLVEHTIIAFNPTAAIICQGGSTPQLTCCDLYGNTGGDYVGCVAGQDGQNGNISEDPLFVDPANGDFSLQPDSPCSPTHSGTCGLIGSTDVSNGADILSHDIGNCVLSVTDQGTIGFLDGAHTEGSGFVYPAGGANLLYIGSLWVGQDSSYVANRDYDADPSREWAVSTNPDGHLRLEESSDSDQQIHGACTDRDAASPLGLSVDQQSSAWSTDETRDDFVILRYTLANHGSGTLHGLYAGVFLDFDLTSYGLHDRGGTDATLDLAYIADASEIHAGLCLLEGTPGGPPLANLTLIDNRTFVWPQEYVLDRDKFGFLSAGGSEYTLSHSSHGDDYSVLVSAGPLDLAPGEERVVAFAIVGGSSLEELEQNARTAQGIGSQGVAGRFGDRTPLTFLSPGRPNPFRSSAQVSFSLAQPGEVKLGVYDAAGRLVRTLADGWYPAAPHTVTWDSRDGAGRTVASGIYFVRRRAGAKEQQQRLVFLR